MTDLLDRRLAALAERRAALGRQSRTGRSSRSCPVLEDGQRRVVRVARHPICIVGGVHHECHVWIIRDVTQQKLAEEMRDSFVDTATHELRTPLANIKAYAETLALADMIDVEQQKQFLNTINSEATRLARFVDDLLSVSSMEVGSMTLNKTGHRAAPHAQRRAEQDQAADRREAAHVRSLDPGEAARTADRQGQDRHGAGQPAWATP